LCTTSWSDYAKVSPRIFREWGIFDPALTAELPFSGNGGTPMADRCEPCRQVAKIVMRSLSAGKTVEIDGLGVFRPDSREGFRFEPTSLPQVFIAYAKEDQERAARLYRDLEDAGFSPWMDVRKLLAGQNWPRAIETAIDSSDFFVACFSANSVRKKGGFQAEIRYALDCARQVPLDEIFIVPARLNECNVPRTISHELQYIDLFPDWDVGVERLVTMMRREVERRRQDAA
jgi:hypothetical protein